MITNSSLTVYHQKYDVETRMNKWERHNYNKIWWFGGKGSSLNKGYVDANDVDIRIPYDDKLNVENFSVGDILVRNNLTIDITRQQDLKEYETFNITSINDNNFGNNPHIHLGGK